MAKKIQRGDEADFEANQLGQTKPEQPEPVGPPKDLEEITSKFVAFGGDPKQMADAASIASAGLVIADQLSELNASIQLLIFTVAQCK